MGCRAEINIQRVTYPVINNQALSTLMGKVIRQVDHHADVDTHLQTMGSEDFSFMMKDIPGCFVMVGSANDEKGFNFGHHHPKFNIDEACLPYAVAIIAQVPWKYSKLITI